MEDEFYKKLENTEWIYKTGFHHLKIIKYVGRKTLWRSDINPLPVFDVYATYINNRILNEINGSIYYEDLIKLAIPKTDMAKILYEK